MDTDTRNRRSKKQKEKNKKMEFLFRSLVSFLSFFLSGSNEQCGVGNKRKQKAKNKKKKKRGQDVRQNGVFPCS